MNLTYEVLTKENCLDVLAIKHKLFPESNSDADYDMFFNKTKKSNYYLVKNDGKQCAIVGWYDFDNKNIDAFVGWFGVLKPFRRKGIGTILIKKLIDEVSNLGFKNLRTYTDKKVNYESTILYNKIFDVCEDYKNDDKIGRTKNFLIYTKFLTSKRKKWNNRPLNEDTNYNF